MRATSTAKKRLETIEVVFAALAHPARRQILLTVHFWGGAMQAGEVAKRFGHSWPTTTRHLQVLVDAGFLTQERSGRTSTYRMRSGRLDVVREWLGWFDDNARATGSRERALRVANG